MRTELNKLRTGSALRSLKGQEFNSPSAQQQQQQPRSKAQLQKLDPQGSTSKRETTSTHRASQHFLRPSKQEQGYQAPALGTRSHKQRGEVSNPDTMHHRRTGTVPSSRSSSSNSRRGASHNSSSSKVSHNSNNNGRRNNSNNNSLSTSE